MSTGKSAGAAHARATLFAALFTAASVVLSAGPAAAQNLTAAQNVTAMTPEDIAGALEAAGLSPEPFDDAAGGAPVIRASAGEIVFWTRGFDCSGDACSTLMLFANFEIGRAVTANDFRVINRYNESRVFGRAYAIEADRSIGVDYVIELDGGVSPDNVSGNIARWMDVIDAFIANFREGPGES